MTPAQVEAIYGREDKQAARYRSSERLGQTGMKSDFTSRQTTRILLATKDRNAEKNLSRGLPKNYTDLTTARRKRNQSPSVQELTETAEKFSANSAASCKDKLFESLSTTKYAKHTKKENLFFHKSQRR